MARGVTSAQFRLGVQIGHLLSGEIRDGMAIEDAQATLTHQIENLLRAQAMDFPFASYRAPARCPCCDQLKDTRGV